MHISHSQTDFPSGNETRSEFCIQLTEYPSDTNVRCSPTQNYMCS